MFRTQFTARVSPSFNKVKFSHCSLRETTTTSQCALTLCHAVFRVLRLPTLLCPALHPPASQCAPGLTVYLRDQSLRRHVLRTQHTTGYVPTQSAVRLQQQGVERDTQSALCCGIVGENVKAEYCKFGITRVTHVTIAMRLHFIVQVIHYLVTCSHTTFIVSVCAPRNLFRPSFLLHSTWSGK